jgi:hypothetical protein
MEADECCRYLRGHWSIENQLHWRLDVVFREDAARVACGHAPENLNVLRKIALTLLRAAPDPRPKDKATVRIRLDGSCSILHKGKMLLVKELYIPRKGQVSSSAA